MSEDHDQEQEERVDSEALEEMFLDPDESSAVELAPEAPAEPVVDVTQSAEYLAVVEERDDFKNRMLRSAADLENFRRRSNREKDELRKYGIDRVVLELLPVLDNLDRAIEHADESVESSFVDGVRMVQRQFVGALQKHGVEGFDSKGSMFDPTKHEAIQQQETTEHATGTIVEEYQRGYFLNDRLIRPALVVVARNIGPAQAAPEDDIEDAVIEDTPGDEASDGNSEPTVN